VLTFDRNAELALFKRLAREPHLMEWLRQKLSVEINILVSHTDFDQVRKAQGRAQLLHQMTDLLEAAAKRPD
jgi:hypothetical protein